MHQSQRTHIVDLLYAIPIWDPCLSMVFQTQWIGWNLHGRHACSDLCDTEPVAHDQNRERPDDKNVVHRAPPASICRQNICTSTRSICRQNICTSAHVCTCFSTCAFLLACMCVYANSLRALFSAEQQYVCSTVSCTVTICVFNCFMHSNNMAPGARSWFEKCEGIHSKKIYSTYAVWILCLVATS